ncbi:MAG: dinitrogenase iron-molybdenum cofactor [Propionibacteriaceae bacterium]|jgi:predicted Fe-Mo cluster-binding NifX family protein|nr:dinitrogenase iron-molybdenum cofactor [Propionibacteriaceae bacterium]
MILAVNVIDDQVGGGLGRAHSMAVAEVEQGEMRSWTVHEVGWDVLHDAPSPAANAAGGQHNNHGAHHARIVRFLKENRVEAVVTGHMGPPMAHTLELLGVVGLVGAAGDARKAALAACDLITQAATPPNE